MRRARNAPPVEGQFKCVCGFSHDLYDELLKHKRRTACDALYAEAIGQAEAALRAEEPVTKKVRRDAAHDARKRSVSLELADLRYTKLVAGTHVDAMKAMHVKLTKEACASAMQGRAPALPLQVDAKAGRRVPAVPLRADGGAHRTGGGATTSAGGRGARAADRRGATGAGRLPDATAAAAATGKEAGARGGRRWVSGSARVASVPKVRPCAAPCT